ncbi:MAG TPA: ATP-binding protein [Bryobacteraceae bacterium]|nr:ATP-binding protein [Bryobacteraceae bacterium]
MSEFAAAPPRNSSSGEVETLRQRVEDLESQLAQSQKLTSIGSLAGGVAHDFNNLLTAILGYASLLREDSGASQQVVEALEVIEKAADRASQLTSQLLGFARCGQPKRVRIDLHQTLLEVAALLRHTIDKNIRLELRLEAQSAEIIGDPGQMFQVFLNLALNARDAMPDGGVLTLSTSVLAGFVRVSVSDTGAGIPGHLRDRIFEPFFTTKGPDKGTGMGLTVVQGIMRAHAGRIEVQCEAGTSFHMLLPVAPERARQSAGEVGAAPERGKGLVLVVDDEEVVRQVAARMLKNLGYHTICLGSSREAIDYYRRRGKDIDLVIIDLIMPDLSGKNVFEKLREINPRVRVVLTSGYNQDAGVDTLIDAGAKAFLQKPYRLGQLSEILIAAMKK